MTESDKQVEQVSSDETAPQREAQVLIELSDVELGQVSGALGGTHLGC